MYQFRCPTCGNTDPSACYILHPCSFIFDEKDGEIGIYTPDEEITQYEQVYCVICDETKPLEVFITEKGETNE